MAHFAGFIASNVDLALGSENRLFKFEGQILTQIGSTLRPASAPAALTKHLSDAKKVPDNVAEVLESSAAVKATLTRIADTGMSEAVVHCALFTVAKDGISLASFLEFLFRIRVVGVAVGMKLEREFAVSAFKLCFGRAACYSQNFVVIAFYVAGQNGPSKCFDA